jgi:hypothetical protein
MSRLTLVLSLLALAVMQTTASATVVRNVSTSTTVFYDNYEGVAASTLPPIDSSGLYHPVATTGTWTSDPTGNYASQVVSLTSPAAAEGSNCFRMYHSYSTPPVANESGEQMNFTSKQSNTGDVIEFSQMVYLPSATDVLDRYTAVLASTGYADNPRVWIGTDGAGGVYRYDAGWAHVIDTGVRYATDTWQRWDLTYAVGASTFSLKVGDGPTVSGLGAMSSGDVGLVMLINNAYKNPVGGSFYVDAVPTPEPSALVLLSCGLFGLLAYAWRKRK